MVRLGANVPIASTGGGESLKVDGKFVSFGFRMPKGIAGGACDTRPQSAWEPT